jgi:AcrR family transcriptional regulator
VKTTTVDDQHLQPEKRTRMSGEERRALILRSAKRVFARSTYAEASTGELARESEITEPMLYKHFGSKKGLFLAVLAEFGGQFLSHYKKTSSAGPRRIFWMPSHMSLTTTAFL